MLGIISFNVMSELGFGIISDFIMKNLPESLKSKINYLKNEKKLSFTD